MTTMAIRPLNSSLEVIAKEQLNEEPEKIQEILEAFKEWIKKSPHLKARTDDQFLVSFLRGCKYSLEKAKQKFDLFYTLRTHIPEVHGNRDPLDEKLHAIIKAGVVLPLPLESPGAPRLVLFRISAYDPAVVNVEEVTKVFLMITDILLMEDDNLTVAGQAIIGDLAGISLQHIIQLHPAFLKKGIMLIQDGSPIRQKGINYINAPTAFLQVFNLIKSFMNEKMRSRLVIHPTFDSLYGVIPREMMPTEYEGSAGSIQSLTDEWEKKLLAYRDYFIEEENYGVDEKKRIGRPKNPDSLFGIDGTFRQLQFD